MPQFLRNETDSGNDAREPASFAQLFFSETEDEDLAGFDDELCR